MYVTTLAAVVTPLCTDPSCQVSDVSAFNVCVLLVLVLTFA